MKCWFGAVALDDDVTMQLNEYGIIAFYEWNNLSQRFSNFESDVFQIMPNHMHGVIVLNEHYGERAGVNTAPTIGDIVGAYKSLVANRCLEIYKSKYAGENQRAMGKLWQRNYYEHIIRNEASHRAIADYIIHNPAKWQDDKFYIK